MYFAHIRPHYSLLAPPVIPLTIPNIAIYFQSFLYATRAFIMVAYKRMGESLFIRAWVPYQWSPH